MHLVIFQPKNIQCDFYERKQMIIYIRVAEALLYPPALAIYLMIYGLNRTGNSLPKDIKKILSKEDQCNLFITSVEIESYLENMTIELNLYRQDKD